MIARADRYSAAFSREATTGRYPKVSFADYEAHNYPQKDEWLYSSYWYKDFDGMAFKTMLRQLISKWGIMSIDMQAAISDDGAVITDVAANGEFLHAEETPEATLPEPDWEPDKPQEAPETPAQAERQVGLDDV